MTPARLLGLHDTWVAWQFNEAIYMLGAFVETRLAERDKRGRPRWTVEAVLAGRAKRSDRGRSKASLMSLRAAFGNAVGPIR